jgi:hypothetical protein
MHLTPVILIENFPLIDIRQPAEPSKSDSGVEGIYTAYTYTVLYLSLQSSEMAPPTHQGGATLPCG